MKIFLHVILALLTPVCVRSVPIINEVMAENESGITDEDGAHSDWIEIHNPAAAPAELANWCLTDDATNLAKWRLPAVTLPAGGFVVVFASGKNRATAGQTLHTNFSLEKNGEFLALVQPDGQTIASQLAPTYPGQRENVSYGRAQDAQVANLIGSVVPSYLVPTSATQLAPDWNHATMADSAGWQTGTGTGATGYDTAVAQPGADLNLAPSGTATQSSTNGSFAASLAINNNLTDFTHTVGSEATAVWTLNLGARKLISKIELRNRADCCGARLRDITVRVKDSDNTTVVYTSALLNPENTGYAYPNGPAALTLDFGALVGGQIVGQYVEVSRTRDADLSGSQGQGNGDEAGVLSMSEVIVTGQNFASYAPFITTDVKNAMLNVNSSAFVRWPFTVADPAALRTLRLRIRHDDGFVAYLNGVEIARRNAPASTSWNSAAPVERDDALGVVFETIDAGAFQSALVPGANVLAVHAMTSAPGDPDFLLQPQLEADTVTENNFYSYLRDATPGALNDSTWFVDFVADTNFSVKRGFFTAPFEVAITTPTAGAEIFYSTNGAEPEPGNGTLYTGPITIAQSTVLRARAFKADWEPTNVDTNTYLFLSDVLGQNANGQPPPGWPAGPITNASGEQQQLNYGMDSQVRTLYGDAALIAALQQVPTLSIVTELPNLFDPLTGIYANAKGHGEEWERPASMEWLEAGAAPGEQGRFQLNFGLRIRGGYSRNPQFIKHSFRAYFRGSYGAGKLEFPIFGTRGASEFDVIDLASSQNYSWANGSGDYETMVRDPFARETLVATGSPGSRHRYFHLYLNGTYWGVYNFDERPSAGTGVAYFGGSKDDYDVVKTGNHNQGFATEATDGYFDTMPGPNGTTVLAPWRDLWNKARTFATNPGLTAAGNPDNAAYYQMLGRNADGTRNPALPVLVDVDSLIDYMLVIFYTGDGDAPLSSFLGNDRANNWFAFRNRNNPNMGFVFYNHDAEHTLGALNSQENRTGPFNGSNQNNFAYSNPQWLFQDLAFSPEFRLRVADRAQRHFYNNGAMTAPVAQARLDAIAAEISLAVKAHSQRWGDTTKSPAYNATDWQNAVAFARNWLTNRTSTVVQQLKDYRLTTSYAVGSAPLFPTTVAPSFNQQGGSVAPGFQVTLTAPAGQIYYTLNGSDPRTGVAYAGPISLDTPGYVTVSARALSGDVWSALATAVFVVGITPASTTNIAVTEIHYQPAPGGSEFIELMNIGTGHADLSGARFTRGIEYTFPDGTVLAPGARMLLIEGTYGGSLSDGGEQLTLISKAGSTIRDFTFDDSPPWPTAPDGGGPSLVLIAPETNPDHNASANWRASTAAGGNPSTADSVPFSGNPLANLDGDGWSAFAEHAFGLSDAAANGDPVGVSVVADHLEIAFPRGAAADDVRYTVESSTDLLTWESGPAVVEPLAHGPPVARWRAVQPRSAHPKQFLRVRIEPRVN